MVCGNCHKKTTTLRSVIRHGKILNGCDSCIDVLTTGSQNDIATYNRNRQREDYAQDIVQPFQGRDYIKARGIDKAREMGYSEEDIRRLA